MVATDAYVPIEDVAKYFSVSVSTVRSWLRQGFIPKEAYLKVGHTYRFKINDVEKYLVTAKQKEEKIKNEMIKVESPQQLELNFGSDEDA